MFTASLRKPIINKIVDGVFFHPNPNLRGPDTFGRTIIEAFAVGVPLLAAKLGGPLDLIEEGKNGLFSRPGTLQTSPNQL